MRLADLVCESRVGQLLQMDFALFQKLLAENQQLQKKIAHILEERVELLKRQTGLILSLNEEVRRQKFHLYHQVVRENLRQLNRGTRPRDQFYLESDSPPAAENLDCSQFIAHNLNRQLALRQREVSEDVKRQFRSDSRHLTIQEYHRERVRTMQDLASGCEGAQ